MTTKTIKPQIIKTPNYKTLELLSSPNFKSLVLLSTVAILTFGAGHAHAADLSTIVPTSQTDAQIRLSSGTVTGTTTVETSNGIVPIDPATRNYVKDNARLEAASPSYVNGGGNVNIQTDGSGTNTRITDANGNEVRTIDGQVNGQVNAQGQTTSTTTTTTTSPNGQSVTNTTNANR
jgi:hypothetical protein